MVFRLVKQEEKEKHLKKLYYYTEDAINGATKEAKKFKQATMGFDELNIISPDSSSGSGSGSGGGAGFDLSDDIEAALDEYEKVWDEAFKNMQNKAEELANKFMSYVEANNWFGLGKWIGTGLTNQLASIPWEKVYSGAKNFGKGLAEFLNGLISPELFFQVGRTIAGALNTALYTALNFGKHFDWKNFGESIGSGINGFFKTYDFKALAETLNVWVDGLEDAFFSAISTIEWKEVFKGLRDFTSNLDLDTIVFVVGAFELKHLGKKLGKIGLAKLIGESLFGKEGSLLVSLKTLRIKILNFLAAAKELGGFKNALAWALGTTPANLMGTLATGFSITAALMVTLAISWDYKSGNSKKRADKLIGDKTKDKDVANALQTATTYSSSTQNSNLDFWIANTIIDSIKKAWKDSNVHKEANGLGENIYLGIAEGEKGAAEKYTDDYSTNIFDQIWKSLQITFGVHSPAKNMYPMGEFIFLGILEGFKSRIADWKKAIEDWFNGDVKPWFTVEKWKSLGSGIKKGLSTKWSEFSDWWKSTGFYNWWTEEVVPKFDEKVWTFEGIEKGLTTAWNNAITSIKAIWNNFADWMNECLNIHIDGKSIGGKKLWDDMDIQLATLPKFNIPKYSVGGMPEDGLFMANHGELVGKFSNGKTAVANNEQIVEGIKSGVQSAVAQALVPYLREIASNTSDTASNTDAIAKKPVQTLSDRSIAKANIRGQRSLGLQLRTT